MRKALKIALWIIGSLLLLLLTAIILLMTPQGKEMVRKQAESFLRKKLQTTVNIGGIDYSLPKFIELKDILFLDQAQDTLLAAHKIKVDMHMLKLIGSHVDVQEIYLEDITAHIYRHAPDTNFNFTYIINAFVTTPSGETQAKDTSGGSTLTMDMDKLVLSNIRFHFDDYSGGNRFGITLDTLFLKMEEIDPNELVFNVDKLFLSGVRSSFIIDTSYLPPSPDTSDAPITLQLAANEINLRDIHYNQQALQDKFSMDIAISKLIGHPQKIDLYNQTIEIKDLLLDPSDVVISIGKNNRERVDTSTDVSTATSKKWRVLAAQLQMNQVNFKYDDENIPRQKSAMDYAHLDVTNLTLAATTLYYTTDTIGADLKHLSLKEQSGFNLRELRTRFLYHPQGALLTDFYLQTDNTLLQHYASVQYPSLASLTKNINLMQLHLYLENSIVGFKDILLFAPQLAVQDFFKKNRNARIRLDARLDGSMAALMIKKFAVSGLGNTEIALSGKLFGLPDADKLRYDLHIATLKSSRKDMEALLPPSVLQQISLPDRFGAVGSVSGSTLAYHPNLFIVSTDGNIRLKGFVSMEGGSGRERYDVAINTKALNLGKILKNPQLGYVSADIKAKGRSFDVNKMNAMASGAIHAATFNDYTYNHIRFNGKIADKKGAVQLQSADSNLRIDLTARADFQGEHPAVVADAQVDSIDLGALHFYEKQLKVRGKFHLNFPELNPDYPQGIMTVHDPSVGTGGQNYYLDSIYLTASPSPDSGNNIRLNAQALTAHIWGHTPLSKIGAIVQQEIDRHYVFNDSVYAATTATKTAYDLPTTYDLSLKARLVKHPILKALVPDLKRMDSLDIAGNIRNSNLSLSLDAPKIIYGTMDFNGARMRVNGDANNLSYRASLDRFISGTNEIWNPTVSGAVKANTITATVSLTDKDSVQKYRIATAMRRSGAEQIVQLQSGLLLNYKEWQVNEGNKIVLGNDGFYVQDFGIRKGNESITVNSRTPAFNAPLKAEISNFLLANVSEMISQDTTMLNGILGGTVDVLLQQPSPQITSGLTIRNLAVLGDTIGNMDIHVKSTDATALNTKVDIKGFGNSISLSGKYFLQPVNGNYFDMNLSLAPLNVSSIEGLTNYAIKNTSGTITGELKLNGTPSEPELNGQLKTNQLTTNVAMLNERFTMPDELISFTRGGIRFNDFTIKDSAGNKATIDGRIITRDYQNMNLAMRVNARNWQAMNSTPKDNKEFSGKLFLSTKMEIFGPLTAPNVDGTLNILKGTDMRIVVPEQETALQEHEGIVKFVNMKDTGKYKLTTQAEDTFKKIARVPKGSEINMNINLNEEANFSIIIDEATGDFLRVRGAAALNTTVAPDGTLGLAGVLEIKDGQYQLNYNLIKRLFRIQPGSTLAFSGDPTEAQVNVTAIYEAVVPPYDLVSRQVDEQELVYYKQRLPFEVHMKLNGELMKPEISFDIVLPEEKSVAVGSTVGDLVQARLTELRNNPSDLNKQVFALIILNRFVAENPFESGAGRDVESIARQSASRFISEQLNKFAGGLVQGLDLTMDLATSEDYTTGERRNRTDLNVSASKKLLNDRLTLTVGNNFHLEGPQSNSTQGTSFIPGNLAADYDLSRDRKYRMRIYRRNEDRGIVDGYVVKTGASFIMTLEYNKIRRAFMSRKKKEQLREQRRKQREQNRQFEDKTPDTDSTQRSFGKLYEFKKI